MDPIDNHLVTSVDQLRSLYRQPGAGAAGKIGHQIDDETRRYLALSPFCLIATSDETGACDVSPRGGPPGMVRVLDDKRIAVPDLNGNNLLDTLQNIIANPQAGLIAIIPGLDETVRFEGAATLSTDPDILRLWDDELRTPTLAIVIEIETLFIHCAKSFRRAKLWDPASWTGADQAPDICEVYNGQTGAGLDTAAMRAMLDASYVEDLAADKPLAP